MTSIYLLDTENGSYESLEILLPLWKERFQSLLTPAILSSAAWWIRRKVIGWGFLDMVLLLEANISLLDCEINISQHGKPEITNYPSLHYNLSHSGPYFLIGVSSVPIGVDIEGYRKINPNLAKRVFTLEEQQRLPEISDPTYHQAFLTIWTRKESYTKALGTGYQSAWDQIQTDQPIETFQWFTQEDEKYVFSICYQQNQTMTNHPIMTMDDLAEFYSHKL